MQQRLAGQRILITQATVPAQRLATAAEDAMPAVAVDGYLFIGSFTGDRIIRVPLAKRL